MRDDSIREMEVIYKRNKLLLFILQEKIDQKLRENFCSKCSKEQAEKKGCINHNGRTFCKFLVNKRKKIKKISYAWQFNLLNYSPLINQSELLSKIANCTNIF